MPHNPPPSTLSAQITTGEYLLVFAALLATGVLALAMLMPPTALFLCATGAVC